MKNTISLVLLSLVVISCKPEIIEPKRPTFVVPVKTECEGKPSVKVGNDVFCVGSKVMNGPDRTLGLGKDGTSKSYGNIGRVEQLLGNDIIKVFLYEQSNDYKYPEKSAAYYGKGYRCITSQDPKTSSDYNKICVDDKVFDTFSYHRQWGIVQEVFSNGYARVWFPGSGVEVSTEINGLNKNGSATPLFKFSCLEALSDQGKSCIGIY